MGTGTLLKNSSYRIREVHLIVGSLFPIAQNCDRIKPILGSKPAPNYQNRCMPTNSPLAPPRRGTGTETGVSRFWALPPGIQ
ncbi:MAG: hypothetical protein F6K31_08050 [Symploca sp. SIO2G7]|nr:hypothetical protein [Symploca sp. SIO2G7]